MEKFVQQTLLFDFYGELLTEHQRQVYEDVVCNDLSYSEAAEQLHVSRQGVFDLIKRCNQTLNEYESKLHLVERFLTIKSKVRTIRSRCEDLEQAGEEILLRSKEGEAIPPEKPKKEAEAPEKLEETIRSITRLCDEILEEL